MRVTAKRILSEKRAIVVPLAVTLLANVAIYVVAVYPLALKVHSVNARAAAASRELGDANRVHAAARATEVGKDRAGEELRRFYRQVLPADLAGARRITYLRLAQLADRFHLRAERRSAAPDDDRESHLSRLHITMVLEGEYDNVRQFIYQLETAPEFVVIEDVSLAEGNEQSAPLVLTLELATYFRSAADGR